MRDCCRMALRMTVWGALLTLTTSWSTSTGSPGVQGPGRGSDDRAATLGRAWREAPTLTRLRRLFDGCSSRKELVERADSALKAVPSESMRQRALLHLLCGDLAAAAALLSDAPGLGWSGAEHPGHLLFPVFVGLLSADDFVVDLPPTYDEIDSETDDDRPSLRAPSVDALLRLAALDALRGTLRLSIVEAMRAAADKRVFGVTANKRRRHYGHAASLAVQCEKADGSPEGQVWLRNLMGEYHRYPALKREFVAAGA
jgi:hypothetical protein